MHFPLFYVVKFVYILRQSMRISHNILINSTTSYCLEAAMLKELNTTRVGKTDHKHSLPRVMQKKESSCDKQPFTSPGNRHGVSAMSIHNCR